MAGPGTVGKERELDENVARVGRKAREGGKVSCCEDRLPLSCLFLGSHVKKKFWGRCSWMQGAEDGLSPLIGYATGTHNSARSPLNPCRHTVEGTQVFILDHLHSSRILALHIFHSDLSRTQQTKQHHTAQPQLMNPAHNVHLSPPQTVIVCTYLSFPPSSLNSWLSAAFIMCSHRQRMLTLPYAWSTT